MYAFKHLPNLHDRPRKLEERIFERFFEAAAIARFDRIEREQYEESLKYYRDLVNVTNSAVEDGMQIGREQGVNIGMERGLTKGFSAGLAEAYDRLLAAGIAPDDAKRILGL